MKKTLMLCFAIIFFTASLAAASTPTDQLKKSVDAILDLLNDQEVDMEVRNKKIETIVKDRFDFNTMAQWILGIHWRKATPEQREKFVNLFRTLLETNYRDRIGEYADEYNDERVEYIQERIRGDKAMVDTQVVTEKQKIPINYKMVQKDGDWVIYDVVIEEVSLVSNYRNSYDEIVRKEGYEGLFSRMEKKIEELKKSGGGKIIPAVESAR